MTWLLVLALTLAWAVLVIAGVYRRAPLRPARRQQLGPRLRPPTRSWRRLAAAGSAAITHGGRAARAMGRRPSDPDSDRRAGLAVVAAVAGVLAVGPVGLAAGALGWTVPWVQRRRRARRADWAVVSALPDTVDLFVVAVASGLNVALAVRAVGPRAPPVLGAPLVDVAQRVDRGERLADALDHLPAWVGDRVRPLVTILVTSVRYGAPLLESLERLAADVRTQRRRAAEEAARRVPVKLLFPLVFCVLPAFALLTVIPLLAGTLRGLRL